MPSTRSEHMFSFTQRWMALLSMKATHSRAVVQLNLQFVYAVAKNIELQPNGIEVITRYAAFPIRNNQSRYD